MIVGVATTAQSISLRQLLRPTRTVQLRGLRDLGGDGVVRLDEAGDFRLRHLREDARVQSSEVAGADDTDGSSPAPSLVSRGVIG